MLAVRKTSLLILSLAALALAGACRGTPRDAAAFALLLVEQARDSGVPAEMLHEPLIARLRRVQMLKRVDPSRVTPKALEELWQNDGESRLPEAERLSRHQSRATQGIRRTLIGRCKAELDEETRSRRVALLTRPVPNAPDEANAAIAALAGDLAKAQAVRVSCAHGTLGVLAIVEEGYRVIDLFDIEANPGVEARMDPVPRSGPPAD